MYNINVMLCNNNQLHETPSFIWKTIK
jgi:hypothetical protein